jgi:hypothetical protein
VLVPFHVAVCVIEEFAGIVSVVAPCAGALDAQT